MEDIQVWLGRGDIGTTMNLYTGLDLDAKKNIVIAAELNISSNNADSNIWHTAKIIEEEQ